MTNIENLENTSQKEFVADEGPGQTFEEMFFKEYQIKGDNDKLYNLIILQTQKSISFHVKEQSNDKIFKKEILLEEFYNLNRFFRQYLSLEELFTILFKNLKNSEIKISENDNNKIKLSLIFECRGNEEEISFNLLVDQTEVKTLIFNLCEQLKLVCDQKNVNVNIIKEFNDIKTTLKDDKNKSIDVKRFSLITFSYIIFLFCLFIQIIIITPIKKEINNIKYDIININNNIINSRIIRNHELSLIEDEIQKLFQKKIIKYELLFRASRDGYGGKDFHEKCDGYINTMVLVETKGGRRFGGFTDNPWSIKSTYNKNVLNQFTFSLDYELIYNFEKKIYNNNYNNYYYNHYFDGPFFEGKHGFKICDNSNKYSLSQDYSYGYNDYSSYRNIFVNTLLSNYSNYSLAESSNFYVKNYEVYKIYLK